MRISQPKKYINLIRRLKNWEVYFWDKYKRNDSRITTFQMRKNHLTFNVPKKLYSAFKELFLLDHYDVDFLSKKLPTKPVIIDIGANAGYFSILMLSKFPEAKLLCFEPLPANHQVLVDNLKARNNLKIYNQAVVGKKVDQLTMYYNAKDSFAVSASSFKNFDGNADPITVPAITLTEIIRSINGRIDLLKIDCEGGEYDILYRTSPNSFERIDRLVLEVHNLDKQENNITGMNGYLTSLDFKTRYHQIDRDSYVLHAWRNS